MRRSVWVTVGAAVVVVSGLRGPMPARAAGQLLGQSLRPASDLEGALVGLLSGLLGGGQPQPQGRIERAVVSGDDAERLAVTVACSSGLEGRTLRGELLGRDKRAQLQFQAQPARIDPASREAELVFVAPSGGDELPESAYLRLSVEGAGSTSKRVYHLGKRWGSGSSGAGGGSESGLLRVRPRPETLAAALPASEPTGPVVSPPQPRPRGGVVRDHRPRAGVIRDHRTGRATPAAAARVATPVAAATPSTQERQVLLARTAPVARSLPLRGQLLNPAAAQFTLSTAEQGLGARGPGADAFDLLDDVVADDIDLDASQVTSLHPLVYADQNPASGFFYFRPRSYHLQWLKDQGRYNLAMLYLAAAGGGSAGQVSMAAGLTAGVDRGEIELAEALVRAYCARYGRPFRTLRPLPIDATRVAVSLASTLRLFDVPPEKVAPVGLSDVLGELQVAWVTDSVTKENVQLVMEQGGINGSVSFPAAGASLQPFLVDLQIKLADPGSFGRARWRRGEAWRNPSPYPLRLKHLHALVLGSGNQPVLYSWSLGDTLVPPGARVEWDPASIPSWIDAKAKRMWVSYGVREDCDDCDRRVLEAITGGVSAVNASQITFHTISPIAETGAYELAVRVRSRHFDPEGREVQERQAVLKADNQDYTVGPIYAGSEGPGTGALFEYFLTLGMPDGTTHEAQRWVPSRDLRVLIGRSQIEKALGFVPGGPPAADPQPAPDPTPEPQP